MKECYMTAELEIIRFDTEDVITTSPLRNGGDAGGISTQPNIDFTP